MAQTYDTFVFDLDGTVLDTVDDLVVLTNAVLQEEGYPTRTRDEILSFVGNGVRALMYQAVPGNCPEESADRAMRRWKALYPAYPNDHTAPYPGITDMLDTLKARGCKLGILSNKFDGGVTQIINQCLPGYFDVMHGEGPGIPRKPDPTGLLKTINELGSTPERTVYVGDSPGDIRTARNAGTYAVGVSWGYHKPEDFESEDAMPDMLINQPSELLVLADTSA